VLFFALERYGVSPHCIKLVKIYYTGLWSKCFSASSLSSWHRHERGIFAGCTLSIILFLSGINVPIEHVLNCDVQGFVTQGTKLPLLRAFMDDMNLMSPSVHDTSTLLSRCCTALTWGRMKFKASKSRYVIIKSGRVVSPSVSPFRIPIGPNNTTQQSSEIILTDESVRKGSFTFALPSDPIPSIIDNPVRFLGRIIDGSLTDRKNIEELDSKLKDGLLSIDRSKFKGTEKLWILQHLLMQRIRWPLLLYEVPMTHAVQLEQHVSVYIRKWLGLPKCTTNICFYSSSSPCPLPIQSLTHLLKSSKVSGHLQLRDSTDPLVSSAPPVLRVGEWNVSKAVIDAETDIQVKGIIGQSQTSRAGLGIVTRTEIPKSKKCKEYRDLVSGVFKEHEENAISARAVSMAVQCQWMNWTNYVQSDLRWANILAMPPNLLSFCLKATYNTLPSPSNLRRMNITSDTSCKLCHHSPCTVQHTLSGCKVALEQDRFTFRHDSVLRNIVDFLKDFITKLPPKPAKKIHRIRFVAEGRDVVKKTGQTQHGILHLTSDWHLTADIAPTNNYVFPPALALTLQRPDILLYSQSLKRVVLIELTCPCEERFEASQKYKLATYRNLIEQIKGNGWGVDYFPIEVGARGYCSTSVRRALSCLGLSSRQTKTLMKTISFTSMKASFVIWLARESLNWNENEVALAFNPASPKTISKNRSTGSAVAPPKITSPKIPKSDVNVTTHSNSHIPSKPTDHATSRPIGLMNKGQTCYANSILQALASFPAFWSVCPSTTRFHRSFRNVMSLLSSNRKLAVDPSTFLHHLQDTMRDVNPASNFLWNNQQDVPEVLAGILENITSSSLLAQQRSCISVKTILTCSICSFVSAREETHPFLVLSVKPNLSDALADFFSVTTLDGDNRWECPICLQKQKAFSSSEVMSVPDMLIVVLRRYAQSVLHQGSFIKNTEKIACLSPVSIPVKADGEVQLQHKYKLAAAVHHDGLFKRGHYFAHIKNNNRWFNCNDRAITPSVVTHIGSGSAYVLFLQRV